MNESIFDIKLVDGPMFVDGDVEKCVDGGRLDNGTKCMIEINDKELREYLSNKATFITIKFSRAIRLVTIKPSTTDNVGPRRRRKKLPDVI